MKKDDRPTLHHVDNTYSLSKGQSALRMNPRAEPYKDISHNEGVILGTSIGSNNMNQ